MKHLTTRLVILLMLALMTISGVHDYIRLARERERLVAQTRDDQRIFAETLALAVSRNARRGRTSDELEELLHDILARPGLIGVALFDPDGRVVASNVASGSPRPRADEAVRESLAPRGATSSLVTGMPRQILRDIQPFRWPGGQAGAIEIQQSLEGVQRKFRREIRERIIARLVVLAAFVLSVVALTRWSIARPIRALIRGAHAVGRGDLGQRLEVSRRDEIGELAEEFNRMAENLQTARQGILRQSEERLRLEQEVQQAQKLAVVGMLAAKVAHEIGTPLNVITGRAEVLERTLPPGHSERRHLDGIVNQVERISGIIRALLYYTRPRRPTLREVSPQPILARVADLLQGRCRALGVRIHLDIPPDGSLVLGDADQLQQLFLNLLRNALDASPEGGTIRVTAGPDSVLPSEGRARILRGKAEVPCLALHIVDGGQGMSAEQLDHVFQPFFSTKRPGQGTGLGLPIAEEIVRAHQGEIELLSIAGRGTEAIVRLPRIGAGPGAPEKAKEPALAAATHER